MAQKDYVYVPYPKWMHHPDRAAPSELVHDEEGETAVLKKWNLLKEEVELALDNLRDNLMKRATKLSVKIDNRWSDVRLQRAVEEAESAKKDA